MALTTNKGQEFNQYLWDCIGDELGLISDFEIKKGDNPEIQFKSNGINKSIYCNDENFKFFIQSAYYIGELISPIKKYIHSDLVHQDLPLQK